MKNGSTERDRVKESGEVLKEILDAPELVEDLQKSQSTSTRQYLQRFLLRQLGFDRPKQYRSLLMSQ